MTTSSKTLKSKKGEIEKVEVFEYQGYLTPPKDSEYKNELWVQLKLLQDKINEIVDFLNNSDK